MTTGIHFREPSQTEQTNPKGKTILSLPIEILAVIHAHLEPNSSSALSRSWRDSYYFSKSPDFSSIVSVQRQGIPLEQLRTYWNSYTDSEKLDLSNSDLTDDELQKIVEKFPNITELDASNCRNLTDASLRHLGKLPLRSLKMGYCGITNFSELGQLKGLTILDLAACPMTDLSFLSHLPNLKSLNLSACDRIRDLSSLSNLEQLTFLLLKGCDEIRNLAPLSSLTSLLYLDLGRLPIIDDQLIHLSQMPLETLILSGCRSISTLTPLSDLKKLRILDLQNCNGTKERNGVGYSGVVDSSLSNLKGLEKLTDLNLNGCEKVTDAGFALLKEMENLTNIGITKKPPLAQRQRPRLHIVGAPPGFSLDDEG